MKGRIKMKGGDEYDAFSPGRKYLCCLDRPGVVKKTKRKYNKRVRQEAKQQCLESQLDLNEGSVNLPRDTSDCCTD